MKSIDQTTPDTVASTLAQPSVAFPVLPKSSVARAPTSSSRSSTRLIILKPHIRRRRLLPGETQIHIPAPPVVERVDRAVEADAGGHVVPALADAHDLCTGVG